MKSFEELLQKYLNNALDDLSHEQKMAMLDFVQWLDREKLKLANWECEECGYVNDGEWLNCHCCKKERL